MTAPSSSSGTPQEAVARRPAKKRFRPKKPAGKLTEMQAKFAREYLVDCNGTRAAIRAGASPRGASADASRWLRNTKVQDALKLERDKLYNGLHLDAKTVLREWARVAFSNMEDYIHVQADGTACVDLSKMDRAKAAALSEIQVDEYTKGKGEDSRDVKRVKVKFHSKVQALDALSKHLGLYAADNRQRSMDAFLEFLGGRGSDTSNVRESPEGA